MIRLLLVLAAIQVCAGNALASKGEELAKKTFCMACHAIDEKRYSPSMKEIAARYRNDPEAQAKLEKKTRKGGSGNWERRSMPMPPAPESVSDDDIKEIVQWILSLE